MVAIADRSPARYIFELNWRKMPSGPLTFPRWSRCIRGSMRSSIEGTGSAKSGASGPPRCPALSRWDDSG